VTGPLPPPGDALEVCVVVPARDDEADLAPVLRALAAQDGVAPDTYEVIVVLAGCSDAVRADAIAAGDEHPALRLVLAMTGDDGAAEARRTGMDLACHRLLAIGRQRGRIVLADAEMPVGRQWLATAPVVATAEAYARGGGATDLRREEELLERSLQRGGVLVRTRRARGGTRVAGWLRRRSYPSCARPAAELALRRTATVSVVVPAKEVAETIGAVVDVLVGLRDAQLVDEVLVVDAGSADGTARVAAAHGADVAQEDELRPDMGPALGKGDAMWRGLAATTGEIVVYVDADSAAFHPHFVTSLLAPLFEDETLALVKGSFRRPFRVGETVMPSGGGRVTELLARPLLNLHRPELAGFAQPLAGEIAARRSLLERLSFPVGYGVEIAMLLDAHERVGIDGLGQADLGERQNRHQSLEALSAMALAVLVAAERRIGDVDVSEITTGELVLPFDARQVRRIDVLERPPLVP
jgi:glycosyltransferase involved in cell wall biosynthesis